MTEYLYTVRESAHKDLPFSVYSQWKDKDGLTHSIIVAAFSWKGAALNYAEERQREANKGGKE